ECLPGAGYLLKGGLRIGMRLIEDACQPVENRHVGGAAYGAEGQLLGGAVAPATLSASRRVIFVIGIESSPRDVSISRNGAICSERIWSGSYHLLSGSAFQPTQRDALDEVPLADGVHHDQRGHGHGAGGHQHAPLRAVIGEIGRKQQRYGEIILAVEVDQRGEKLIP